MAHAKIASRLLFRELLKDGNDNAPHRSWKDSAANDDGVPLRLELQSCADLLTNSADKTEVKIAINLAGSADADK